MIWRADRQIQRFRVQTVKFDYVVEYIYCIE